MTGLWIAIGLILSAIILCDPLNKIADELHSISIKLEKETPR